MGKQLQNLTFDEWLTHVFDHPVEPLKQEWYWDMDRDWWEEDTADSVRFMTQAFEHAAAVLAPYSDAQLNQGLWFLASNACSSHMFALMNESLPLPERTRCILSFHQLYEQCFARRCTPHLSHLNEAGASPLNGVCYMWWDIIPFYGKPDDPSRKELDEAMRSVSAANLQGMREEIDSYDEIRDNISNLTFFLKDMNTLTPEMHENSNFASLINALEKRIVQVQEDTPSGFPAPKPVKVAETTPTTAPANFDAYLIEVTNRLARDGYKELRGERAGSIRFKKALELLRKGFLGSNDIFRVLFVQADSLDDDSFIDLEKDLNAYGRELTRKLINNVFIICVLLAGDVPESVKDMIYNTKRPKVGLTDVSIVVMVAYSGAENDIFYPSELPDDYESKFEENIKQYLLP